jgi:hypothetical protein
MAGVALLLAGGVAMAAEPAKPVSYGTYSDAELTELGTRWESLSVDERKALLAEVKMRMVKTRMARDRGRSGVLKIRTTRQYGVVRKPDGTTVRVQRQVVRVVPVAPSGRVTFGMGFEQRHQQPSAAEAPADQQPEEGASIQRKTPVLRASSSASSQQ